MKRLKSRKIVNYVLVCIFAVLWIAAMIQYIQTARTASIQSMAGVIKDKSIEDGSSEIVCRGQLDGRYYLPEEKKEWIENVLISCGIPADGEYTEERKNNIVTLTYIREGENASADFKFITKENEVSPEEVLVTNFYDFNIRINGVFEKAYEFRNAFMLFSSQVKSDSEITLSFSGIINEVMDENEMEGLSDMLLNKLSAKKLQSNYSEGIFDAYGYSDEETDYIISNGEKINVNIVMIPDSDNGCTKIYIGTPVLNGGY